MSNSSVGVMSKSNDQTNNPNYIQGVNGLRALAIVMVIGYHLFPNVLPGGFLGVNLFFVLSGFLLAVSSARRLKNNAFNLKSFYLSRIIRIFIPLILAVALTVVACKIWAADALRGIGIEVLSIFGGFNNIWQIMESSSYFTDIASSSPLIHLWYLSIEMQFYLVWPLLLYGIDWLRKKGFRGELILLVIAIVSVVASIVLYSPYSDPSRVYYGTDTRIYSLCIGAFVGYRYLYPRSAILKDPIHQMIAFIVFAILTLFGAVVMNDEWAIAYTVVLPLSAIVFSLLVFIVANKKYVFGLWLDLPIFQWLNTHSYILYLIHYPIIFIMINIFGSLNGLTIVLSSVFMFLITLWIKTFENIVNEKIMEVTRHEA